MERGRKKYDAKVVPYADWQEKSVRDHHPSVVAHQMLMVGIQYDKKLLA
jgi:hypothetical protein